MTGADLTNANLKHANLTGTKLCDTDFRGARFGWTVLAGVDLREAKNLDLALHEGPSIIGIDVVYESKGLIPESFLRGTGVPDSFIT